MSAYTRIRPAGGSADASLASLAHLPLGEDSSTCVDLGRRRGLTSHAGLQISLRAQPLLHRIQEAERRTGGWCATLVRRHPPTNVVQVSCTTTTRSRSCPVGTTAKNSLDDTNAVTRHSIDHLRS